MPFGETQYPQTSSTPPQPKPSAVPTKERIIRMLVSGQRLDEIRARYPQMKEDALDKSINEAVMWRNKMLVPARAMAGKTIGEIAQEFGLCRQRIFQILANQRRNRMLQEKWGGLQSRTVDSIRRRLHCHTLEDVKKKNLNDEAILAYRGIGIATLRDIRRVIPSPKP